MTISTTASSITTGGNGATTEFDFDFVWASEQYIQVTYTDPNGIQTVLTNAQYDLFLNPVSQSRSRTLVRDRLELGQRDVSGDGECRAVHDRATAKRVGHGAADTPDLARGSGVQK